jgi:S-adenosylmethionine synthetase
VVDNYGPNVPVGGGSFSGKDYTKVDRSGAYIARKIAVQMLGIYKAKEVLIRIAYVIGEPQPIMKVALVDGEQYPIPKAFDLTPQGIKKMLKLDRPQFAKTAVWGHFGRGFIWDSSR